jgi:NAD(P)-dependent dehydrogenase (short-subunit alcohol dehydrogenase family)
MIREAEQTYGKLTVLFNNAGISHADDDDAIATTEDVWDLTFAVNVKGVFLGCKYGIPALRRAGGGSIINTASFVAILGAATPQLAYTASKGAVLSMSRELAAIHARENIRVNALCPGPLQTELLDEVPQYRGKEAAPPRPHPHGPLRPGPRNRPGRSLSRLRGILLRRRHRVPRRRRHHRGVYDTAMIQRTISPVDGSVYAERELSTNVDALLSPPPRLSLAERIALCQALVAQFEAQADSIGEELTWQMGRPLRYTPNEIRRGFAERARYMISIAEQCLADIPAPAGFIRKEPVGVVFTIAPWNYPYLCAVNSIVPAILAGNAVLLKASARDAAGRRTLRRRPAAGDPPATPISRTTASCAW